MTTLAELRARIAELRQLEDQLIHQERAVVIQQVRQQIADFNLTAAELGFTLLPPSASGRGVAAEKAVVRYRRGDETWSGGRGPKPKWVRQIIASGEDIERYRVG
ncbi:MAG: hypothetical protein RJA44_1006 [Pseudomonadota bacterium]